MRTVLHLLTAPPDEFTDRLLQLQKSLGSSGDYEVQVVDLSQEAAPDYDAVLDRIFSADSVSVW